MAKGQGPAPDWLTPGTPQLLAAEPVPLTPAERRVAEQVRQTTPAGGYPDAGSPHSPTEDT